MLISLYIAPRFDAARREASNHLLESFINSQLPKLALFSTPLAEQQRNKKKIKREKYTHRVFDDGQQLIKRFQKEKNL